MYVVFCWILTVTPLVKWLVKSTIIYNRTVLINILIIIL